MNADSGIHEMLEELRDILEAGRFSQWEEYFVSDMIERMERDVGFTPKQRLKIVEIWERWERM